MGVLNHAGMCAEHVAWLGGVSSAILSTPIWVRRASSKTIPLLSPVLYLRTYPIFVRDTLQNTASEFIL